MARPRDGHATEREVSDANGPFDPGESAGVRLRMAKANFNRCP